MAAVIGKRKRPQVSEKANPSKKAVVEAAFRRSNGTHAPGNLSETSSDKAPPNLAVGADTGVSPEDIHLQIVTGSYERLLHGISVRIPRSTLDYHGARGSESNAKASAQDTAQLEFSDAFLFAPHASAIRCLAISPATEDSEKRYLASGSSDERINVYSLSTAPPLSNPAKPKLPSLTGHATAENSRNRSVGSLIHHDRAIVRLQFPTKSKLFSAAEDSTIAISRTRDWTVLSSIKAPIPKPQGRPSGDTAGPGEFPAGINDFAIHPSQKLMLSVGRGEKSMRLWNLMTGKKAGVLAFERSVLTQAGEGKFSSGEARRILWDGAGENFVVGFERGAVLFNIGTEPRAVVRPTPSSKMHQMQFLTLSSSETSVLTLSTEDGRILFFSTDAFEPEEDGKLPLLPCIAQLGGADVGVTGRIKDYAILPLSPNAGTVASWIVAAGSSDGAIRLFVVHEDEIAPVLSDSLSKTKQIGRLLATHETGDRVTCLVAFVLDGKVSNAPLEDEEAADAGEQEEEEESEEFSDA